MFICIVQIIKICRRMVRLAQFNVVIKKIRRNCTIEFACGKRVKCRHERKEQ